MVRRLKQIYPKTQLCKIHVAGKEREEDWVGIQCVAWFAWSPGHYDNAATRAGVTLLR